MLVVAAFRNALTQPHAGGLESHVWTLVRSLRQRGHRVVLAAPEGSDFLDLTPPELVYPAFSWPHDVERTDAELPPEVRLLESDALRSVMRYVVEHPGEFDVVHNHSLSPEPHLWVDRLPIPMVTTLHTPPLPELCRVMDSSSPRHRFLVVSRYTADSWAREGVLADVVENGVDTGLWTPSDGGPSLCWFGRIVPEKAPHLAIDVARHLGVPLTLAGPVGDPVYAERRVFAPAAGAQHRAPAVEYLGPLCQKELSELVGASLCTLVTPVWEEPFGQVVVESLACGTPVVGIRRGGMGQVFGNEDDVRLVEPSRFEALQVARLARETRKTLALHRETEERDRLRRRARYRAVRHFSMEAAVDAIEEVYGSLVPAGTLAARSAPRD